MEKIITKIKAIPTLEKKTRVAAYARVSSGKDAMLHSLSAQVSYYNKKIQSNEKWQFIGVYCDEAKTGTKEERKGFQALLTDCRQGKIDMIITKSITRFARNLVTLLATTRELKKINVDIYFEEQNLHTNTNDGELLLSILAIYAQEESRSNSENQKWRIRKNFEQGIPWNGIMLGYRRKGEKYEIVLEEAKIVKMIYSMYLNGNGIEKIIKFLNENKIQTRKGFNWNKNSVLRILRNINYTGNLLLQRFFSDDYLTKKKIANEGQQQRYFVEDSHKAIISKKEYDLVQQEILRRAKKFKVNNATKTIYPFTSKIICANCGKHYRRKTTKTGVVWICSTYNTYGKAKCNSKAIPEQTLQNVIKDNDIPLKEIVMIKAKTGNLISVITKDNKAYELVWKDRSRADSWGEDKRIQARENRLKGVNKSVKSNCDTTNH